MKILALSDEICPALWEHYVPGKLDEYDLIISCGDLKPEYLSFLVTVAKVPLLYVHGNHDERYLQNPPEGCDCIEDKIVVYKGLRILGLGGCFPYNYSEYQYTEWQMLWRIWKLKLAIAMVGGVDIVVTHAAPRGVGDSEDRSHRGFEAFLKLIDTYHPKYLLHGHVHMSYGHNIQRVREYHGTKVINCCERYELDYDFPSEYRPFSLVKRIFIKLFMKNLEIIDY